mgnify:CR=1 FL=1
MMKKILLCASMLIGISSAATHAQSITRIMDAKLSAANADGPEEIICDAATPKAARSPIVAKALTLKENEMWWGYFNGKYRAHEAEDLRRYGSVTPVAYSCGIKLRSQSEFNMGKGKTIEGIKFVLPDIKNMEDVQIWITTTLPNSADMSSSDICVQNISKADLVQARNSTPDNFTNEIRFDTPYTIGDKDVYVGYSLRITKIEDDFDKSPIVLDNVEENILSKDGAFIRRMSSSKKWFDDTYVGVLAMQVLFSSEDFKENSVEIESSFSDVAVLKNSTAKLPLTLTSTGMQGLKSFKYVVTNGGKVTGEQTVTLDTPVNGIGGRYTYEFPVVAGAENGVFPMEVRITEVNGVENENSKNVSTGEAVVVENKLSRKAYIEDYTGTWSSGYAFGYANKIKLRELYAGKAAIVSVHNGMGDPMAAAEYDVYINKIGLKYFPNTDIDRTYMQVYPYLGTSQGEYFGYGYANDMDRALAQLPVASVDVDSKLSDDWSKVDVEAKVKFEFNGEKKNYSLFYVLTEDGMQDASWVQNNGMGDYAGIGLEDIEPLFEPFINGKKDMTGLVYDDVVVASRGAVNGIKGSITPRIKTGEVQTNKISFDLAEYPIIQDKTKLKAFAVLIDTKSGKVVNANECKVAATGGTAISGNTAERHAVEAERYTIDGRKMQQPTKGINIIRYSDGRVQKSIAK